MSHTPGPWTAAPFSSVVGVAITAQPDKAKNTMLVASTFTKDDGRLIAAAPELLEILKDLVAASGPATIPLESARAVRQFSKFLAAHKAAEEAIAKATGGAE